MKTANVFLIISNPSFHRIFSMQAFLVDKIAVERMARLGFDGDMYALDSRRKSATSSKS